MPDGMCNADGSLCVPMHCSSCAAVAAGKGRPPSVEQHAADAPVPGPPSTITPNPKP